MKNVYLLCAVLAVLMLCSCKNNDVPGRSAAAKKLTVVTTLFPLYDFARAIGGSRSDVTLLLPPGMEAHSFQPKPEDAVRINKADVFIYTNEYMEPWAIRLVQNLAAEKMLLVDSSKGVVFLKNGLELKHPEGDGDSSADSHRHGAGMDPHIWLDFSNAGIMVDNIAAGMVNADPANKDFFLANAQAYKKQLTALDEEYRKGLANCGKKVFLHGGHYTFGYLARRYGLQYESASAVNADAEPTPGKIIELVKKVKTLGLSHVFSEELLSPRLSEVIAREAGVSVMMLHGAHNISSEDFTSGVTFVSLMKKNLNNLKTGLNCVP